MTDKELTEDGKTQATDKNGLRISLTTRAIIAIIGSVVGLVYLVMTRH